MSRLVLGILILQAALARPSHVSVGGDRMAVVDAIARLEPFFSRTVIKTYFFATPLSAEQERALSQSPLRGDQDFVKAIGAPPVFQIWLFLTQRDAGCRADNIASYTAIFQQSKAFPIGVTATGPINFAITRAARASLGSIGIRRLDCSLAPNGTLSLSVSRSWNAERPQWDRILPAGRNALLFSWDVDVIGVPLQIAGGK